jgi:hypothetical protein
MQPRVLHLLARSQMAVILGTMMAVAIKILRIPGPTSKWLSRLAETCSPSFGSAAASGKCKSRAYACSDGFDAAMYLEYSGIKSGAKGTSDLYG